RTTPIRTGTLSLWSPARWRTTSTPAPIGEDSAEGEKRTRRSTGPGEQKIEIASPTPNTTYKSALENSSVGFRRRPGFVSLPHERGKHGQGDRPRDRCWSGDYCHKRCEPRLRRSLLS